MPVTGWADIAGGLAGVAPVAVVAAALSLAFLFRHARRLPSALPNERTLHETPVCRVGGLSIAAGFVVALLLSGAGLPGGAPAWAGLTAIAAVSLVDDWRGVPPPVRLVVHVAAAAVAAAALPGIAGAFGLVAATLAIAWSANLYNFMDGSDGLAATMAVCGFSALAAGAWIGGAAPAPMLAVAAASLPLLAVNAPPARMFMGDVGAVPLGFLAALFGIAGWGTGTWPAWFPLLVFLPFIVDATLTLGRRTRVGGAQDALLPAAAPARRRTSRDARLLRHADRRHGVVGSGHTWRESRGGLVGVRRLDGSNGVAVCRD
jgi:UDP-GlcNAc:undecaprenyl-phosphate GlcNAc-1-phosphate transferase